MEISCLLAIPASVFCFLELFLFPLLVPVGAATCGGVLLLTGGGADSWDFVSATAVIVNSLATGGGSCDLISMAGSSAENEICFILSEYNNVGRRKTSIR